MVSITLASWSPLPRVVRVHVTVLRLDGRVIERGQCHRHAQRKGQVRITRRRRRRRRRRKKQLEKLEGGLRAYLPQSGATGSRRPAPVLLPVRQAPPVEEFARRVSVPDLDALVLQQFGVGAAATNQRAPPRRLAKDAFGRQERSSPRRLNRIWTPNFEIVPVPVRSHAVRHDVADEIQVLHFWVLRHPGDHGCARRQRGVHGSPDAHIG